MAGSMKRWAAGALIALALTAVAGQAGAVTIASRGVSGPLGGPRWTEIARLQRAAGVTLLTPAGALITLRPRSIGTFGRAGWGDYRLRGGN